MLRLARTLSNDPVTRADDVARKFGGRLQPSLDKDFVDHGVSVDALSDMVPNFEDRRKMLSRDALASVDGFRIIIDCALKYLFGIRKCANCPKCYECSRKCCQDAFGSNAEPTGGILGRVEAVFASIEAQKSSGSLHAHVQVFAQCIHQHTLCAIYSVKVLMH